MARKFNLNVRLGVECLEDRNMAATGLNATAAIVPVQSSQPTYSNVQTISSPMLILGMDSHGTIGSHLDYVSGLRVNHNETLVRTAVRKRRAKS